MPPLSLLPLAVPLINGHYYSFASIECNLLGHVFADYTGITYSTSLDVADVHGTRAQKLGTTRGKQNAEATLEMYRLAWENFRNILGGVGYGEVRFPLVVQYAEIGMPVITDVVEGARVVKVDHNNADGTDPTKVSLTLNVMRVLEGSTGLIALPKGGW